MILKGKSEIIVYLCLKRKWETNKFSSPRQAHDLP